MAGGSSIPALLQKAGLNKREGRATLTAGID